MRLRRFRAPLFVLSLGASFALLQGAAGAQRGIDSQLFRPSVDSYGIFTLERAEVSHQWDFGFKLYGNFAGNPLRLTMGDDEATHTKSKSQVVMDRQIALNLGIHLGLTNWLELILDFPISSQNYTPAYGLYGAASDATLNRTGFYRADKFTNVPPPDAAPLDARIGFKAKIFRKGIFGVAAAAIMTLPFGDDAAFLGDTNFTFRPNLIADLTRGPITVAVNVGAIIRQETKVYDPFDQAAYFPHPRLPNDRGRAEPGGPAGPTASRTGSAPAPGYSVTPRGGAQQNNTPPAAGRAAVGPLPPPDLRGGGGGGARGPTGANRPAVFRPPLGPPGGRGPAGGGRGPPHDGIPDARRQVPERARGQGRLPGRGRLPRSRQRQATASPTRSTSARTSPRTRTASRTTTAARTPTTTATASPTRTTSARTSPRTRTASRTTTAAPIPTTTATASPTRPTSARTSRRRSTASRTRTAARTRGGGGAKQGEKTGPPEA